jgi:hypothetical protein
MFRQGDLLFVTAPGLPVDAEPASRVLAVGETTGHRHQATGQLQVFKDALGHIFLTGSGQIVHEEHNAISLPEGVWEMRRQREYVPGTRTVRTVED